MGMSFQAEKGVIRWKMHFTSPPEKVFAALATEAGRARYWAESAPEANGTITFHILNYEPFAGHVLGKRKPALFKLEYFGTIAEFSLRSDEKGGTDLTLVATEVDESIRMEMVAGWVSVLMAMKAAVDHGVDLRNHDASRAWGNGYADN
jgi:Activator of Hsp90 ATPase homolog 1-like protein